VCEFVKGDWRVWGRRGSKSIEGERVRERRENVYVFFSAHVTQGADKSSFPTSDDIGLLNEGEGKCGCSV
jgi:hypothetical protein